MEDFLAVFALFILIAVLLLGGAIAGMNGECRHIGEDFGLYTERVGGTCSVRMVDGELIALSEYVVSDDYLNSR